jgi:flagellar hook-associated protein 3 FlgL
MSFHAIGDLAQYMTTRRHSANLQARIGQLTQELSTGRTSNVTRSLNASFGHLADVEHQIALNTAHKTAATEASVQAGAMQTVLDLVQTQVTELSGTAMLTGDGMDGPALGTAASTARGSLNSIVAALNTGIAGRPVFGGTVLDNAPLISADDMMDIVLAAVSTAGDAASVIGALDAFFDSPGGGFETDVYTGGNQDFSAFQLGGGESVYLSIRADDEALRAVLKDTVMAVLAGESSLLLNHGERLSLLQKAGDSMLSSIDGLTRVRSDLGAAESRIDQSVARIGAERTSLSIARNELMSVDLFETATALEQAQFQLETIYTLTARTSRLNLVNFL